MKINVPQLIAAAKKVGGKLVQKPWHLNIIGLRTQDTKANTFNDVIFVLFKQGGEWVLMQFGATTDPGTYYREAPINVNGTAIVKPGFYPNVWKVGMHRGRYKALVQRGPITVFRDDDRNAELDIVGMTEDTGYFGINLHRANANIESKQVDRWSAGCQVIACPAEYQIFMSLVNKHCMCFGNAADFSYTLITEVDYNNASPDK